MILNFYVYVYVMTTSATLDSTLTLLKSASNGQERMADPGTRRLGVPPMGKREGLPLRMKRLVSMLLVRVVSTVSNG